MQKYLFKTKKQEAKRFKPFVSILAEIISELIQINW